MSDTAKSRVIAKHPKAYVKYVGLSLKFVVVAGHSSPELSGHFLRERDAWADAAKKDAALIYHQLKPSGSY